MSVPLGICAEFDYCWGASWNSEVLGKSFGPVAWMVWPLLSQGITEMAVFCSIYLVHVSWDMLPEDCVRGGKMEINIWHIWIKKKG